MPNKHPSVQVRASIHFKRKLKRLVKKYRRVRSDIEPIITLLEQGETPGDRVQGVKAVAYKIRAPNTDAGKGKSGGYRIIYYIQTRTTIILIMIYSKTEQANFIPQEIARIIKEETESDE